MPISPTNIPEVIETDRFILRCPMRGDGEQYFAAIHESYDQLKPWFGSWIKNPPSKDQAERMVMDLRQKFLAGDEITYFIFTRTHHTFVGVAYIRKIDWDVPKGMIGYWTRSSYQRMGVGQDSLRTVVALLIENLAFQRLELHIDPTNQASLKLASRVGFCMEGRLRNYRYDNFGRLNDFFVYSMTPADYFELLAFSACDAASEPSRAQTVVRNGLGSVSLSGAFCPLPLRAPDR